MDRFYLVNVRDELPLPGHVDFLVIGPHLALNSEKQDFQVPLLSKSKQRKPAINIILYFVLSKGKMHLLLEKKIK